MDVHSDRTRGAGWARGIGRALAGLWARVRASLRRLAPRTGAAGASAALPAASPGSLDGDPGAMLQRSADPGPAPVGPAPVGPAPVGPAPVGPAPVAPAPVALEIVETPVVRRRDEPASAPGWSPELATMRVRQFFGRLVMAAPGAAEVDLGEWPRLTVERFFLAVGSPRAMARREAATSGGEAVSLGNAFEGFEWD